ncbi:MAG TPA: ATP-dependent DNA helicase [Candidatus Nanoarchaeia archaeon]|nr:ATP-dependent DNA helicase [Candidatus Nanoarchaeia archaeon]
MSLLEDLNPKQLEAVTHTKGPILVVAGAGTGKTQVITRRIAYLIEQGLAKPDEILALTFTDKAAGEMESRLTELLGYLFDATVTTFNAFGNDLINRYGVEVGLDPKPLVMSRSQQMVFLLEHYDELEMDYFAPVSNPVGAINYLLSYFSSLKNELVRGQAYKEFAAGLPHADEAERQERRKHLELANIYVKYLDLCQQHGRIDYDDQIVVSIELLEKRANLLRKLQRKYRYILVDEFQDTNRAQSRLLELLSGKEPNLMVVGDDDQSIYGFRGAAIANILEFNKRFPQAKQVALTQNYRSTQQILDTSHRLIKHNDPDRLENLSGIDKSLKSDKTGDMPEVKSFSSDDVEADWLAGDIKQRIKRGSDPSQIAVLLRKHRQAGLVAQALERSEVPFKLVGQSNNLYDSPEVRSIIYALHCLVNPNDSDNLYHLLAGPIYDIDRTALRDLVDRADHRQLPLEKMLRSSDLSLYGLDEQIPPFLEQLEAWRELLPRLSSSEMAYQLLEDSGYLASLTKRATTDPSVELVFSNLNQYLQSLKDFEAVAEDKTAVGYVKHLGGLQSAPESAQVADVDVFANEVQVLTVHRAKGLEFDHVYLYDMTKDSFPSRDMRAELEIPVELTPRLLELQAESGLSEERRLMYVAMTRARQTLTMSWSVRHKGLKRPRLLSQFVTEALGDLGHLVKPTVPDQLAQLELFRYKPKSAVALQDRFWRDGLLVLGAHQIEDYLKCPAEFYWKYVVAIPRRPAVAMVYGRVLHEVVRYYHQQRAADAPVSLENLIKLLHSQWPDEGFASPGHAERSLKQAERTLAAFYKREEPDERRPTFVEHKFDIALPEVGVILVGRYDAVYSNPGQTTEIRDYKTGGATITDQAKADERTKDNKQLAVYALAWLKQFGQLPDEVTLDFLDVGLVGRATKTAKQIDAFVEKVQEAAEGIRNGDFKPGSSHRYCNHPPVEVLV